MCKCVLPQYKYLETSRRARLSVASIFVFRRDWCIRAGGVYYWSTGDAEVVAFDMGNEVFRVIPLPFVRQSGERWHLTLMTVLLSVIADKWFEIWVMEARAVGSNSLVLDRSLGKLCIQSGFRLASAWT